MATTTSVPLETYLHTSYRPDCDYVDGELKERNMGEWEHGRLQGLLFAFFLSHSQTAKVATDVRVQIAPTRFRVPDVVVLQPDAVAESIITKPPLLVLEILSPEDALSKMRDRITDYLAFHIPNVWIVDPFDRMGYVCTAPSLSDWKASRQLTIPDTSVTLDLAALPE